MKKLIYLPIFSLVILLSSCDFDFDLNLIPDIKEDAHATFPIDIDSDLTTGFTYSDSLDLTQYEEYEKYKENIISYEVTDISGEITEYVDVPQDLWFTGTVIANDMDSTTSVVIAAFDTIHLFQIYDDSITVDLVETEVGLTQLAAWMEDPGKFKYHIEYHFLNEDKTPYLFDEEDFGSYFKIRLNFSLLLETKG